MPTLLRKPVRRTTISPFFNYGPDRGKPFVVTLEPGDLLTLRPLRSRREESSVTMKLSDLYTYALLSRARNRTLEKARAKKAAMDAKRKTAALAREVRRASR